MKKSLVANLVVVALLVFGSMSQAQDEKTPGPDVDTPAQDVAEVVEADSQQSASDQAAVGGQAEIAAPVQPISDPAASDAITIDPVASDAIASDSVASGSFIPTDTSGCFGCGQAQPMFSGAIASSCGSCGIVNGNNCGSSCGSVCGSPSSCGNVCGGNACGNGYAGCATTSPMTCGQPINSCSQPINCCGQSFSNCAQPINNCAQPINNCAQPINNCGCNGIGQVAYNQPLFQGQVVSSEPTMIATPISVVTGSNLFVNPAPSFTPMATYAPIQNSGCNSCGTPVVTGFETAPMTSTYVSSGCVDCGRTRGLIRGRIFRTR